MTQVMVRHKVNDYETWKKEFDNFADFRKSSGELSYRIMTPGDDQNNLHLIFEWDKVENARKFMESPELQMTMEKAGVAEKPEIKFLKMTDHGKL